MRDLDRFRGCLLAGAAGDALGYPVEFSSEVDIFWKYGENGITQYQLRNGVAEISDDTQMTLFTATGLLQYITRGMTRGIAAAPEDYIRYSYKDWYRTQTESYPLPGAFHYSWLANAPQLFRRRAPGNTCLSALGSGEKGYIARPINHSKGCGGVMRVAPIGLYFCDKRTPIKDSDRIGAEAAALTHGHELGRLPAAALVHIIRRLAENKGETILAAVKDAMRALSRDYGKSDYLHVLLELMQKAIELSQEDHDDLDAIHQLGEGWVAEETLAIAIYCALKYPHDMEQALTTAVNHGGDSDSTGAVTGNILGAALGMEAIPEKFLVHLEMKELILEIADDLYNDCQIGEDGFCEDLIWELKYIEGRFNPDCYSVRDSIDRLRVDPKAAALVNQLFDLVGGRDLTIDEHMTLEQLRRLPEISRHAFDFDQINDSLQSIQKSNASETTSASTISSLHGKDMSAE